MSTEEAVSLVHSGDGFFRSDLFDVQRVHLQRRTDLPDGAEPWTSPTMHYVVYGP